MYSLGKEETREQDIECSGRLELLRGNQEFTVTHFEVESDLNEGGIFLL